MELGCGLALKANVATVLPCGHLSLGIAEEKEMANPLRIILAWRSRTGSLVGCRLHGVAQSRA